MGLFAKKLIEAFAEPFSGYTNNGLMAMTKAQLLDIADALGIPGISNASTKSEITQAILGVDANG